MLVYLNKVQESKLYKTKHCGQLSFGSLRIIQACIILSKMDKFMSGQM
jgi:hypothetical protein